MLSSLEVIHPHKLDFGITKCIYLGISLTHKWHKCMEKSGRVYISKDVIFNEVEFPYPTLQSESSLPLRSL